MSTPVLYGPIGYAVRRITPFLETDALGVYVAALSFWSAAIGGTVKVSSRGNARPVLLWSALVAGTGRGKGTALRAAHHVVDKSLGRFLATHTTSGITSGAGLVQHLWDQQEATSETEHGRDVRTKDEPQEVRDPAMVLHAHSTPSDWAKFLAASDALGGSYNRILPFLLGSVPMLDDDRMTLPKVDGRELADAYGWATARPRVITIGDDARPLWRGGRATSSQVLPFIGATAAEVKALTGIVVTVERSGKTGRPATVFSLRGDSSGDSAAQPASTDSNRNRDTSRHAEPQPTSAEREQDRATVVRLDAYRPEPKQTPGPAPEPKWSVRPPVSVTERPEPLADFNPFRALL